MYLMKWNTCETFFSVEMEVWGFGKKVCFAPLIELFTSSDISDLKTPPSNLKRVGTRLILPMTKEKQQCGPHPKF